MKKAATVLTVAIFTVIGFAGYAVAATAGSAVGLDSAIGDLFGWIADGFKAGHYGEAAMITVVLGAALLRKYGSLLSPKLGTGNAGRIYVLVGTVAATLAATGISGGNAYAAVKAAGMTVGGYALVQMAGGWLARQSWLPGWARAGLAVFMNIFRPKGEAAVKKAEEAGEAAVKANPGKGIGPTGTAK